MSPPAAQVVEPPAPWPDAPQAAVAAAEHRPAAAGALHALHALRGAWQRWHRALLGTFSVAILTVVIWRLQALDWSAAWQAAQALPATALAAALAVAMLGHLNYGAFDLLARRWLSLQVPAWRMAWGGTVSYGFTLNFGSMIGGAAVRWRLLSAAGVNTADTTRVITLAVLTNWIGYAAITGILLQVGLTARAMQATTAVAGATALVGAGWSPQDLQTYAQQLLGWLHSPAATWAGAGLLLITALWVAAMHWPQRLPQAWHTAGLTPSAPALAAVQVALGACNWLWMSGVMGCLLALGNAQDVPFRLVLGAQVIASLACLIARVPGGLGVFEAVYWAMLGSHVPTADLLGALLVFRALYFILPLLIALPGYWWLTRHPSAAACDHSLRRAP